LVFALTALGPKEAEMSRGHRLRWLYDPAKLLKGTGKLHRHVKLKSKADLETAALKSLLKAAIARREKTD
jgi:hypothetical protein